MYTQRNILSGQRIKLAKYRQGQIHSTNILIISKSYNKNGIQLVKEA